MTVQEAADYLGITRAGVWKATKNGSLRQTRNGLYIKPDLDDYKRSVKTGRPRKNKTSS